MEWQQDLAENYGIDGFCFYHYWFKNGKKLLEKPAENLLEWKDIPMQFCFCWANDSWARSWSAIEDTNSWAEAFEPGQDDAGIASGKKILAEQDYGTEKDWKKHFDYLLPFFRDDRYIKIGGKPVFIIYKPELCGCLDEMIAYWRALAEEDGLRGIYVIGSHLKSAHDCLDAAMYTAPSQHIEYHNIEKAHDGGYFLSSEEIRKRMLAAVPVGWMKTYYSTFASYDDSPRRGENGIILDGDSPELFKRYLSRMMWKNVAAGNDIQFINAWNEWGEGNMLEPDERYGYAMLEAVRDTVKSEDWFTEKIYASNYFEENAGRLIGRKVWLYGTGLNAKELVEFHDEAFSFAGLIDDRKAGRSAYGKKIVSLADAVREGADAIVIAANNYSTADILAERGEELFSSGAEIVDMYGADRKQLLEDIRAVRHMPDSEWERLIDSADVISFDLMYTFLFVDVFREDEAYVSPLMKRLYTYAKDQGKEVVFVADDNIPSDMQEKALEKEGIHEKIFDKTRYGCGKLNGLFRAMKNEIPNRKILHFGDEVTEDMITPRLYGIDTFGYGSDINRAGAAAVTQTKDGAASGRKAYADKDALKQQILDHDVISFDIFDTLVTRITSEPEDVFEITGSKANEKGLFEGDFASLRKNAQLMLEEPALAEIYGIMSRAAGLDEETARALMDTEIEVEKAVLKQRPAVIDLMRFASQNGKPVYLVSDMYIPADVLAPLLEEKGVSGYKEMIISCDHGKRKQAGLFDELKSRAGAQASILHIGDSDDFDAIPASEARIDFFAIPSVGKLAGTSAGISCCDVKGLDLNGRLIYGICNAQIYSDPFGETIDETDIRAAIMTAVSTGLVSWIAENGRTKDMDALLFASRDSWLPMKLYEAISGSGAGKDLPAAVYLDVSRAAAESLRDDRSGDIRRNFFKYIREKDLGIGAHYGFVDLFAAGLTQRILEGICPFDITGFYFGVNECNPSGRLDIESFLGDDSETMISDLPELERSMTSVDPSVIGYSEYGPVFKDEERNKEELETISAAQHIAMKNAEDYFSLVPPDDKTVSRTAVISICQCALEQLEKREAAQP